MVKFIIIMAFAVLIIWPWVSLFSSEKKPKRLGVCCPRCRGELAGAGILRVQKGIKPRSLGEPIPATYECAMCGHLSRWDFSKTIPFLME